MTIQFSCPCGRKLQVADELAGKPVRCPVCLQVSNAAPKSAEPEPPMAALAPEVPAVPRGAPKRALRLRRDHPAQSGPTRTDAWAVTSFLSALLALALGVLTRTSILVWFPGGVFAVVASIVSGRRIRLSKGQLGGRGWAWAGFALGLLEVVGSIGIFILLLLLGALLIGVFAEYVKFLPHGDGGHACH